MMTSKQGRDDGVESMLRETERGGDVKNVHGKIGRARERGRQTEKVRETREEDIDKTRGE